MPKDPAKRGFTLVELLVTISIIAVLSAIGMTVYGSAQKTARDAKRKADIDAIYTALELYASQHDGKYPQAGSYAYASNNYVYSTAGSSWIPALVPYMTQGIPVDPINNTDGPWATGSDNYSYAYGNVGPNGAYFDLTARLESTTDPARCGVKNYTWYYNNGPWCTAFGGSYSNQIYEKSPPGPGTGW